MNDGASKLILSRLKEADISAASELLDAYRGFYGQPSDRAAAERFLRQRLESNDSVVFLARYENKPAGFVQLYPSYSTISLRRLWILNDLYVDPTLRRLKIARALMEHATEFARETEACAIILKTATTNLAAQALYESLGWERDIRFSAFKLTLD